MKKRIILGISGGERNSCAALMISGRIIAAAEEERFNRTKFFAGFPEKAIRFCLGQARVPMAAVTDIAVGCFMSDSYSRPSMTSSGSINCELAGLSFVRDNLTAMAYWDSMAGTAAAAEEYKIKLHWVPHHMAHVAAAFFMQEIEKAAFLSVDYMAEWDAIKAGSIKQNGHTEYFTLGLTDSLAALYAAVTAYLGFSGLSDEYKVMGLASYGKPLYIEEMKKLVELRDDGTVHLSTEYFNIDYIFGTPPSVTREFIDLFGPAHRSGVMPDQKAADMAASMQLMMREAVIHMARHLRRMSGLDTLCYTGEFALNCDVNTALAEARIFKNLYIHPASHDAGTAIGACFYADRIEKQRRAAIDHAFSVYLGPGYSDADIEKELETNPTPYVKLEEEALIAMCVDDLIKGKVVGWFQGRMEVGPRALGNRSIIADPRSRKMVDIINKKIKSRESFRPFAPSILAEDANDYFEFPDNADMSYMLFLAKAKKKALDNGQAVVHVDGTSRPQAIAYEQNPLYWKLISKFKSITGVPFILNTSFNVNGEPIVCMPKDALRCFNDSGIDVLYIGNYRIPKTKDDHREKKDSNATKYVTGGEVANT